jgi:hypothetical protein
MFESDVRLGKKTSLELTADTSPDVLQFWFGQSRPHHSDKFSTESLANEAKGGMGAARAPFRTALTCLLFRAFVAANEAYIGAEGPEETCKPCNFRQV